MVKKHVLEHFVKLGGYDIVKLKEGKWKGISSAARKTGLSRPTIYTILKDHPEPPSKTLPKYIEEFDQSEGWKLCADLYKRSKFFKPLKYSILKAFNLLNKKDPISWIEKDFRLLWNSELFLDAETNFIRFDHSLNFRRLMRAIGRHDLLDKFKTKTRTHGKKKLWYLEEEDLITLLPEIPCCALVCILELGCVDGARMQARLTLRPDKIIAKDNIMMYYESKIDKWVVKKIPSCVMDLIQRYIRDFNIKPKARLFPLSHYSYYEKLKKAGERAGITKTTSTHILKHTFVSQAHKHGVSAETVVEQCHTELRTLIAFYRASDEKKIDHELLGKEYDVEPFHQWIERLHKYFADRYIELLSS